MMYLIKIFNYLFMTIMSHRVFFVTGCILTYVLYQIMCVFTDAYTFFPSSPETLMHAVNTGFIEYDWGINSKKIGNTLSTINAVSSPNHSDIFARITHDVLPPKGFLEKAWEHKYKIILGTLGGVAIIYFVVSYALGGTPGADAMSAPGVQEVISSPVVHEVTTSGANQLRVSPALRELALESFNDLLAYGQERMADVAGKTSTAAMAILDATAPTVIDPVVMESSIATAVAATVITVGAAVDSELVLAITSYFSQWSSDKLVQASIINDVVNYLRHNPSVSASDLKTLQWFIGTVKNDPNTTLESVKNLLDKLSRLFYEVHVKFS